jgi:anti-sigma regulatory factor (Ser/Thr protein kinase)
MSSGSPEARVLSAVFVNDRHEIRRLSDLVDRFALDCRLSEDNLVTLSLILDEMVSNVIKYGYDDGLEHQIHVDVVLSRDQLTIEIKDDGKPFNPLTAPPPNFDVPIEQRRIGGLGVYIVKTMVDTAEYKREGDRNILTLRKRIDP